MEIGQHATKSIPIGPHDPGCMQCIELASSRAELLKALEAGDELWAMLPFDSDDDIAEIAKRVETLQSDAIEKEKGI